MKYFKELSGDTLYTTWNTRVGAEWNHSLEAHINILTFMHTLCNIKTAKRTIWKTPGEIKHLCESWLRNGETPNYTYVSRDLCTSFAIAMGTPVDLDAKNALNNRIGLQMTPTQYDNLWWNISNNDAKDFEWAMKWKPDEYVFQTYKKRRREEYGY